jgi:hypothetical protein
MEPKERERMAEQWLDAAFKRYGEAEPRPGLEGRVLVNLRAADGQLGKRVWWPAVAVVAAIAIGASMFLVKEQGGSQPRAASATQVADSPQSSRGLNRRRAMAPNPEAARRRTVATRERQFHLAKAAEPELEQFPSPQPLSAQEQMLARYVKELPGQARELAQAQTQLRQQDQVEFEKLAELQAVSGNSR